MAARRLLTAHRSLVPPSMLLFQTLSPDALGRPFYGLLLHDWAILLVAWATAVLALTLAQRFVAWRFAALARRTSNDIDDAVAALLEGVRWYFLLFVGLWIAVRLLVDPLALPPRLQLWAGRLAFLALLLQVVRWGNTLITFYLTRYRERRLEEDAAAVTTMQAMGFLGRLTLWVVVVLLALDNFDVDITALVASLGIGGIAVALAMQNILGDLFASLSIVLDKPFVVGDFLIVGDFLGSVEYIGLKTTRVRSLSGEQIVFSNSDLLNARVRNYKRMVERRVVFGIGVEYGTPYAKLAEIPQILRETVEGQDLVRFDRAHFKEYGDFSLKYEVVYYVLSPDYNTFMDIQQAINLGIYRRMEAEGVAFAFPSQSLYVRRVEGGQGASSTLGSGGEAAE